MTVSALRAERARACVVGGRGPAERLCTQAGILFSFFPEYISRIAPVLLPMFRPEAFILSPLLPARADDVEPTPAQLQSQLRAVTHELHVLREAVTSLSTFVSVRPTWGPPASRQTASLPNSHSPAPSRLLRACPVLTRAR